MKRMVEYRLLKKANREKLEKDLTIRYLMDNVDFIHRELEHIVELKSAGHRLIETHKLLRRVKDLSTEFREHPRRNMSFYMRRLENIDKE